MQVWVDRQSVCYGDDIHPHHRFYDLPDDTTIRTFLDVIRQDKYLATISGGRATWVCEGTAPLAVVTQEYVESWLLFDGDTMLRSLAEWSAKPLYHGAPSTQFYFRYCAQHEPGKVFQGLGGDPMTLPVEAWAYAYQPDNVWR